MHTIQEKLVALSKLLRVGFKTGSTCFGLSDPKDIDIVISSANWDKIIKDDPVFYFGMTYDARQYRPEDDEFFNFKWRIHNREYDFIVTNGKDVFRSWKKATHYMNRMPKKLIKDKGTRVRLFELLKQLALEGEI